MVVFTERFIVFVKKINVSSETGTASDTAQVCAGALLAASGTAAAAFPCTELFLMFCPFLVHRALLSHVPVCFHAVPGRARG